MSLFSDNSRHQQHNASITETAISQGLRLTRSVGTTAAIENGMNDTKPSKVEMLRFLLEERASKGASEEELNDLKRAIRRHSGKAGN